MVTSAKMLLLGIGFVGNTLLLIITVIWSDPLWHGLFQAVHGMYYSSKPVIDPGILVVIPGIFYGMLAVMWFAMLYCLVTAPASDISYPYG